MRRLGKAGPASWAAACGRGACMQIQPHVLLFSYLYVYRNQFVLWFYIYLVSLLLSFFSCRYSCTFCCCSSFLCLALRTGSQGFHCISWRNNYGAACFWCSTGSREFHCAHGRTKYRSAWFCCSAGAFHHIAGRPGYTSCCHLVDTMSTPNEVQMLPDDMSGNQADHVTRGSRSPLGAHQPVPPCV